jgi:hypothetical protein
MSSLTFLVAESFLVIAGTLSTVSIAKLASDKWTPIVTGIVEGVPQSRGALRGMFFTSWVPYQSANVALTLFLALVQLAMASHVSDPSVKPVAYLGAFLAGVAGAFNLYGSVAGALAFRARLERDERRRAKSD